jgi:hypothetical protein
LDTASSAEASLAVRAGFRRPDAVATGAAPAEPASAAEPESAAVVCRGADPARVSATPTSSPARRLLLRSGAVPASGVATS